MSGKKKEVRKQRWYFGGIASTGAAICTHPLDLIKVHLQTQQEGKASILKVSTHIFKTQGILGFYTGLTASIGRQLTYSITRFGLYEVAKQNIPSSTFAAKLGIASFSGFCGGIVGTPCDMINVRMQNDIKLPEEKRRKYKHVIDGLFRVYKEEGVANLFSGVGTATARGVLMTIGQVAFYDQVKILLLKTPYFVDNLNTHFLSSFIAGGVATVLTQPLDVLKTRMMNAKPGEFKNIAAAVIYTAKLGPLGFFKGLIPSFARIGPLTIITFILLEQINAHFGDIVDA